MNNSELACYIDHTLLKANATKEAILATCEEAKAYHTASVCVNGCWAKTVHEALAGTGVKTCCVVGFPLGAMSTAAKAFETAEAVKDGAEEIDMVINIGMLKAKEYDYVLNEINEIKEACDGKLLKVIIETCLLTDEEKVKMCEIVNASNADYIKTSTGFSTAGATFADVELFAKHMNPDKKIKAAGGITSMADAERFIELGASRLGTSRIVKIVKAEENA